MLAAAPYELFLGISQGRRTPFDEEQVLSDCRTIINCADDEEAIRVAEQWVDLHDVELWQSNRFITRFTPGPEHIAVTGFWSKLAPCRSQILRRSEIERDGGSLALDRVEFDRDVIRLIGQKWTSITKGKQSLHADALGLVPPRS